MQLQDIINDNYIDIFKIIKCLIDNNLDIKYLEKNKSFINTIINSKDFKMLILLEEKNFDINIIDDDKFMNEYNLYKRTVKLKKINND